MGVQDRRRYPTQAKIDMAVAAARRAGIERIGSIEIAPDGGIRIAALPATGSGVADEIRAWKEARAKG